MSSFRKIIFAAAVFSAVSSAFSLPVFKSGNERIDRLASLAMEEVQKDIRSDGTFSAGAKWPTAWTRDMSYAIDLSLALLFPEATEKSLSSRVENGMILQDTGSGGSYPVSTDRVVLGIAMYDFALVNNNQEYFKTLYEVLSDTIDYDYHVNFDPEKNLFRGETSFIDWREQSYPRWANCSYIANSYASGTNAVYFRCLSILSELASRFAEENPSEAESWQKISAEWSEKGAALKTAMNRHFDSGDGYLVSYILQDVYSYKPQIYETLGQSLCALYGITDQSVLEKAGISQYGVKVFDPDLKAVPSYHNNAVWPFVQGYYGLALKKAGYYDALNSEFRKIMSQAEKFGTFKENMVASDGSEATQTNSDRQLWSDAGFLSYIYRILLGIQLNSQGISFSPVNFLSEVDSYAVKGLKIYHGPELDISVSGKGDQIQRMLCNGKEISPVAVIPYDTGKYSILIQLVSSGSGKTFKPAAPRSEINVLNTVSESEKNTVSLKWRPKAFDHQKLQKNDSTVSEVGSDLSAEVKASSTLDVYALINQQNMPSQPVRAENAKNTVLLEAENAVLAGSSGTVSDEAAEVFKTGSELDLTTANGSYIKDWGKSEGDSITFSFNAKAAGDYVIDFRFQNGHGPVNTGEKCAIRAVTLDENVVRRIPLPQQGNWSSWAWSVPVVLHAEKGKHTVSLSVDGYCYSQHHKIVPVNVDLCRIARIR